MRAAAAKQHIIGRFMGFSLFRVETVVRWFDSPSSEFFFRIIAGRFSGAAALRQPRLAKRRLSTFFEIPWNFRLERSSLHEAETSLIRLIGRAPRQTITRKIRR
jgi:hypothetical protein